MKYEIILATENKKLKRDFNRYVVRRNIKVDTIDSPVKLNRFFRKRGKKLEVLVVDMQSIKAKLERFIFYVKEYKINIPIFLLAIDNLNLIMKDGITKEALRNLPIYGFFRAPKNKKIAEEIINELNEILDLDMHKKFEKIDSLEKEKVFSTTFKTGKTYFLKRKEIPSDDGTKIKNIIKDEDEYYFTVYLESGAEYTIPWDFVLSLYEPRYEYYKDKKTDRISAVEIGQRIRKIRRLRKLTQKELAAKTNIRRANIARIESGKHDPALETLEKIADALEVPVANLLAI